MNYLLDTNAVIALLKDQPPNVRNRLRRLVRRGVSIAVSTIVLYELWYGVARSQRRRENAERLRVFLSGNIDVARFDEDDAVTAGDLRAALEAAGTPIGPMTSLSPHKPCEAVRHWLPPMYRNSLVCAVLTGKTGQLRHHDQCRALNRVRDGLGRRHVREAHRPGVAQGYLAQVEIDRTKGKDGARRSLKGSGSAHDLDPDEVVRQDAVVI